MSDLLCSRMSVQNDQNVSGRQCAGSSSQWCACPLISLTKNNGYLRSNGTRTERGEEEQRGREITITPQDMFYHVINSVFSSQILPAENIQSLWKNKKIWSSDKEQVELWEKENEGREEGWSCISGLPVMEQLSDILYLSQTTAPFYHPHCERSGRDGDHPTLLCQCCPLLSRR